MGFYFSVALFGKVLVNVSCHSLCHSNFKLDDIPCPSYFNAIASTESREMPFKYDHEVKKKVYLSIVRFIVVFSVSLSSLSSNKCWLLGGRK